MGLPDPLGVDGHIGWFPFRWPNETKEERRPLLLFPDFSDGGSPETYVIFLPMTGKSFQREFRKVRLPGWEEYLPRPKYAEGDRGFATYLGMDFDLARRIRANHPKLEITARTMSPRDARVLEDSGMRSIIREIATAPYIREQE